MPGFTFVADGSIRSKSSLLVVGTLVLGQDGTGNLKSGNHVALWELETETLGVVVDDFDISQLQGNESLVAASKRWLGRDSLLHLCGDRGASAEVVVTSAGDSSTTRKVEESVGSAL